MAVEERSSWAAGIEVRCGIGTPVADVADPAGDKRHLCAGPETGAPRPRFGFRVKIAIEFSLS